MTYQFLPEAALDLDEAVAWYEEQRPGLGIELLDEFDSCIVSAIASPGIGSPLGATSSGNKIRRYRLKRFHRYAILMATIDQVPTIIAFEHSSRRPRFWKERVK